MAINLRDKYGVRANPPSLDYPTGSVRNKTAPNALDGTPLEKDWANDWVGARDAILSAAGITASGLVETAQSSQVLDSLKKIIATSPKSITVLSAGSGTWAAPSDGHYWVRGWAGGGGSGGVGATGGFGGGGGGGGGYFEKIINVTAGQELAYMVGAGGAAGGTGGAGGVGGTTSIDGATALGGTGGSPNGSGNGGSGGSASGGDFNCSGSAGGQSSETTGGSGGSAPLGGGGPGQSGGDGVAGASPGGGASGKAPNSTGGGAAGGAGRIVIMGL